MCVRVGGGGGGGGRAVLFKLKNKAIILLHSVTTKIRAQSTLDCNTEQSNSKVLFSVFN